MLSIIIVNYNVKYFLEQCLFSVMHAIKDIDAEVIVIDNRSTDGSREYFENLVNPQLQSSSGKISFVWNNENKGFAKANNQALGQAKGDFILFLNPDTILAEDSLVQCIAFMQTHPNAGAVGVKMIDGNGRFLKESKRAYPTLATSFYKLCGLASLFPKSKTFARYHLGHLNQADTHEVDVLAGAFMMVRKSVLDKTGGFDESFFMYGEDIDLSFRIQKLGYKNYYFPGTTIIHFKGESTIRGSLNYVRLFYQAMSIFVQKHYNGVTAKIYRIAINLAIWIRASLSALSGFIRHNGLPIIDAINTLISFIAATILWNRFIKPDTIYEKNLLMVAFPVFTLIFILVSYYAGLYDRQQKKGKVIFSTIFSGIIVLALYSLLPEKYRFSRGILLLGTAFSFLLLSLNRFIFRKWGIVEEEEEEKLGTIVVGTPTEYDAVAELMQGVEKEQRVLGRIAISYDRFPHLANINQFDLFIRDVPVREIIFCQGEMSFGSIIHKITSLNTEARLRFHACGSKSIVGSDSSRWSGSTVSSEPGFEIDLPASRRNKRLFDVVVAVLVLISFPIQLFLVRNPAKLFLNVFKILWGSNTWVGYCSQEHQGLPVIRKGIIGTNAHPIHLDKQLEESLLLLDRLYATEYSVHRDFILLTKGYKWLGT